VQCSDAKIVLHQFFYCTISLATTAFQSQSFRMAPPTKVNDSKRHRCTGRRDAVEGCPSSRHSVACRSRDLLDLTVHPKMAHMHGRKQKAQKLVHAIRRSQLICTVCVETGCAWRWLLQKPISWGTCFAVNSGSLQIHHASEAATTSLVGHRLVSLATAYPVPHSCAS